MGLKDADGLARLHDQGLVLARSRNAATIRDRTPNRVQPWQSWRRPRGLRAAPRFPGCSPACARALPGATRAAQGGTAPRDRPCCYHSLHPFPCTWHDHVEDSRCASIPARTIVRAATRSSQTRRRGAPYCQGARVRATVQFLVPESSPARAGSLPRSGRIAPLPRAARFPPPSGLLSRHK